MIKKIITILLFPTFAWAYNFTASGDDIPVYYTSDTKNLTITFTGIYADKDYNFVADITDYFNTSVRTITNTTAVVSGTNASATLQLSETTPGWYKGSITLYEDDVEVDATNVNIADVNGLNTFFSYGVLTTPPTQGQSSPFGICEHYANDNNQKALQRAGIKWMRMDTWSSTVYPSANTYSWTQLDGWKSFMDTYGTYWLPMVGYGFEGNLSSADESITVNRNNYLPVIDPHWDNYITALVGRYKDDCPYWEIWNEADLSFFWKSTPNDYFSLLDASYDRIKSIDSNLKVLHCGKSGNGDRAGRNWNITDMNNATNKFDYYNTHPYLTTTGIIPEAGISETDNMFADTSKSYMSSKKLWITEYGYPTYTNGTSTPNQTKNTIRAMFIAFSNGVEKFFPYELKNNGVSDSATANSTISEQNFGIMYYDYEPKPAYVAYANLIRQIHDKSFVSRTQPTATSYDVKFSNTTHTTDVLWSTGTESVTVELGSKAVHKHDIMGSGYEMLTSEDGNYTLSLTGDPIYLTHGHGTRLKNLKSDSFRLN